MKGCNVAVANRDELRAAQAFYDSRGYGGAAITSSDFVVLAKQSDEIVGAGRLCQEGPLLWLRGMQVDPRFQRSGVGTRILHLLDREIGSRWCCCLPYSHLIGFYRHAGFEHVTENLPLALGNRLAAYLARGLEVVAMVRAERVRPNHSLNSTPSTRLDAKY